MFNVHHPKTISSLKLFKPETLQAKLAIVFNAPSSALPSSSCNAASRNRRVQSAASSRAATKAIARQHPVKLRLSPRMGVGIPLDQPPTADHLDRQIILRQIGPHRSPAKPPDAPPLADAAATRAAALSSRQARTASHRPSTHPTAAAAPCQTPGQSPAPNPDRAATLAPNPAGNMPIISSARGWKNSVRRITLSSVIPISRAIRA